MLDFSKEETSKDKCIVKYTTKYEPMIISCNMKYKPEYLIRHKEYEADVRLWSLCWWSQGSAKSQTCHISSSALPFTFIASKIEEIVETRLDCKQPYIKYKTTLSGQQFEMVLVYGEKDDDDPSIKDNYQVGDWICGLFRAIVKIRNN